MSELNKKAFKNFLELCLDEKEEPVAIEFFDLFFTSEEKADLATRYLIIQELLKKQKTQREMAKELNVSISKITRGSNELKRMSSKLVYYLEKKLLK